MDRAAHALARCALPDAPFQATGGVPYAPSAGRSDHSGIRNRVCFRREDLPIET
jgi:hypothetical protein